MATHTNNDPRQSGLQRRLETVAHLLEELTAKHRSKTNHEPSKSDLLHDLRVACRRAETALKACRQQLSNKQRTWLRDQMRSLRRSCTPLRDDEVFLKWLEKQPADQNHERLIKSVNDSIRDGRKAIVARSRKVIRQHQFRQHIQIVQSDTEDHDSEQSRRTCDWQTQLSKWLFDVLNQMVQAIPAIRDDNEALHQLRIAVKGVRYALEFAVELDPGLILKRSIGRLQVMQDKLGDLHDAAVRLERIESECSQKADAEPLTAAAKLELQKCAAAWKKWWQPAVLKQIVSQCGTEFSKLLTRS